MPTSNTFSQLNERVANLTKEVEALTDELRSLRRSFYTFAFGVVGSSVVFAFTVFALLGK
jgi:hypothetical protein